LGVTFNVENLCYKYPSAKEDTIKGITFDVHEGEIFGLLGPSGAGKSTTQKILIKLLEDYRGSISYFGNDLKSMGNSFYEEIGVGFEVPVHFSKLTALENMKFFSGFYKKTADIQELMERVGLWEYRDVKVGEYSKGMKVRLNFVRAMLNNPRVLFLDEVTNGLDPRNARIIKEIIAEYRSKGGTVFLTTHLMNDVEQLCDRVAFCINGRLIEISSPRDLKLKYGKREVKVEYRENATIASAVFPLDGIGLRVQRLRFSYSRMWL
jgi:fluoroquinolone transport system ATP-binding protein